MSFAGEEYARGRPSLFTRAQHLQALVWFRAQNGRKGALCELARRYGVTHTAMKHLLARAEAISGSAP